MICRNLFRKEEIDIQSNDTQYTYAVSRIRAIEKNLFNNDVYDRLIHSKTKAKALKVLEELEYGYLQDDSQGDIEFDLVLRQEQEKLYEFLKALEPKSNIIEIFMHTNDYHNAKVILKSEYNNNGNNGYTLLKTGIIPIECIKDMILQRQLSHCPRIMHDAVMECLSILNRTNDPQIIDIILDKENYKSLRGSLYNTKNKFLIDLVDTMIDLININTWLRIKRLEKTWDYLQKILLDGGKLDKKLFIDNLDKDYESILDRFQYTDYSKVIERGLQGMRVNNFEKIEKEIDNYLIDFVKKSKYITFGVEPLVAYMIAKEMEIKNVRIIMVGIINNVDDDVIRERLRDVYV